MKKSIILVLFLFTTSLLFCKDFMVTYGVYQKHYNLDITDWLKDKKNTLTFTLPTTEEFYNSLEIGHDVVDSFRKGSFWFKDSIGKQKITVVDKYVLYEDGRKVHEKGK